MDEELLNEEEVVASVEMQDEIDFINTDAEVIRDDLINSFETFTGEKLYDGDERKIFLEGFAYVLSDIMVHINEVGRENLLMYATGNKLDALGELYGNDRLQPEHSKVTMKFSLSTSPDVDIVIKKGTRVTPDGTIIFATDNDIIFPSKTVELEKEVGATAIESGASYNDIDVGEINKLIDGYTYVSSVSNTTVSSGGSDIESDEEYRERLKQSPFTFSVAGPANAYRMIALGVSKDVSDVSVYSPSAGVVEIAVLKEGGNIPTAEDEILKDILEACSDKDRRPLTDKVQVVPVTGIAFNINVAYYVSNDDISKTADIQNAVEEYKKWQVDKIQRDINPDMLRKMMMDAGAAMVEITEPLYKKIERNQVPKLGTSQVTYKGSISV